MVSASVNANGPFWHKRCFARAYAWSVSPGSHTRSATWRSQRSAEGARPNSARNSALHASHSLIALPKLACQSRAHPLSWASAARRIKPPLQPYASATVSNSSIQLAPSAPSAPSNGCICAKASGVIVSATGTFTCTRGGACLSIRRWIVSSCCS